MTRQGIFELRKGPPREVLGVGMAPPPRPQHQPLSGPGLMVSSPTHGRCVLPASRRPGPVLLHPAPEAEKPSLRGGKRAPNASSPTQRAARTRPTAEQPQLPPILPMPARQGGKKRCSSTSPIGSSPLGRGVRSGRAGAGGQLGRAGQGARWVPRQMHFWPGV